jgi:hypothetical protein
VPMEWNRRSWILVSAAESTRSSIRICARPQSGDGGTARRTEETTGRMTEKRIIQCRCTQVSLNYERQRKQKEDV